MKEKEILEAIKKSMDQAPIDLLENIKTAPRVKMLKHDEITKQKIKKNPFKSFVPYASLAAAFLMVIFGWGYQTQLADSQVYFDVNPSVEITTNRMDKVIEINASNEDGKNLLANLDYKGKTINELSEEILDEMIEKTYLDKDHKYLLFSVYNKNKEKAQRQKINLDKKIHDYLEERELDPIVLSQDIDKTSTVEKYASEYKLSLNKMTFIKNMISLDPKLKIEELVGLSIEELVDLSKDTGLDLEKILDSKDFDKIKDPEPIEEPDLEIEAEEQVVAPKEPKKPIEPIKPSKPEKEEVKINKETSENKIISSSQAKEIALSVANGKITDFDFDEDDLEYEVEIELGEKEYEIKIDAKTAKVLEVEIDD